MKVLCLGNNTEDTDKVTRRLALEAGQECHGLISDLDGSVDNSIKQKGYYHSSIYDLSPGRIKELAAKFDRIIVLNQSKEDYSHPTAFFNTVKLAQDLRKCTEVEFLNPQFEDSIDFFEELVTTNKSFCIFPFIELLVNDGSTTVCCRSSKPITKLQELKDFATDPNYQNIRESMLAGIRVPEHCSYCYHLEDKGILSSRQTETLTWANMLGLRNLDDLSKIKDPAYYEVRPGNVCNLQCRSCTPMLSNLVAREYKTIGLIKNYKVDQEFTNFDFVKFEGLLKLYVSGGEPTANLEFYEFLDRCISNNQTDFEFQVNTNAVKLSDKFKNQIKQFSNLQFVISIDGFEKANDYMRWLSQWDTVIDNALYLIQRHKCSFNVTVSIYNVANLYNLLNFLDTKFPGTLVHCQDATSNEDLLSPFNFPSKDLVLHNLNKITTLNCYKNDKLLKSFINGLINYYSNNFTPNFDKLSKFFEFNDLLDKARNVKLINYIPELEEQRKLLQ